MSASLHVAVLLLGLVTISSSKPAEDLTDYVRVSLVSNSDTSRAALGQENARRERAAKPLVDKIGDTKTVTQPAPKVADKPAIITAAPSLPQPVPAAQSEPKHADKHEQKADRKPDPKEGAKLAKKKADFKPDQIAELLQKNDSEKAQDKPQQETPKYDANRIADLLDKRDPRRQTATDQTLNNKPSLGAPTAAPDAQLSQSEIDAFRERIRECWSPPPGVDSNSNISVSVRVLFKQDGSLAEMPVVVAGTPSPLGPALAESGKRALLLCQPFKMLKPEHYAEWQDLVVDFDPHELSGN